MFITNEAGKMHIPSALLGGEDFSYWGYVKQHLHFPWFYCVYTEGYEGDGKSRHMALLSHPAQLQQMSQMEGIEVVEVQVVMPSHMTNEGRWIMNPLASIWEGELPGDGSTEVVYITSDGRRFCINENIKNEDQLFDKRALYQPPIKCSSQIPRQHGHSDKGLPSPNI